MSTFKGCLDEFPDIRIDYFRKIPEKNPPLACFLSHIHSDHIQGLESLGLPFVYCSPATRELLLGLEKYHNRINYDEGIFETRRQTYKHLQSRLKAIPLNTPTTIELSPGNELRVTLLDANHCVGAVMFLIENESNAVLYTGDIRSEPWWVNALIRNPVILPYFHGIKRLDKIYLDTTFATKEEKSRSFPTKAAGISELLKKVLMYPKDTHFHLNSWTPGYEDVWIALSSALKCQIHVDDYKLRLYKPLSTIIKDTNPSHEGFALCGFKCGNRRQSGCLTEKQDVRLHSCERGTSCSGLDRDNVVYITPIISRSALGAVVAEVGAGGGATDLIQSQELQLESTQDLSLLIEMCSDMMGDRVTKTKIQEFVSDMIKSGGKFLPLDTLNLDHTRDSIPLVEVIQLLTARMKESEKFAQANTGINDAAVRTKSTLTGNELPRNIQFPYSRHSSYDELCDLVGALRPADVYPCTFDEKNWDEGDSMQNLFGDLCSGTTFAHDEEMRNSRNQRAPSTKRTNSDKSLSATDDDTRNQISDDPLPVRHAHKSNDAYRPSKRQRTHAPDTKHIQDNVLSGQEILSSLQRSFHDQLNHAKKKNRDTPPAESNESSDTAYLNSDDGAGGFLLHETSQASDLPRCNQSGAAETQLSLSDTAFESQSPQRLTAEDRAKKVQHRREAYKAVKEFGGTWDVGHSLVSSMDGKYEEEIEL